MVAQFVKLPVRHEAISSTEIEYVTEAAGILMKGEGKGDVKC